MNKVWTCPLCGGTEEWNLLEIVGKHLWIFHREVYFAVRIPDHVEEVEAAIHDVINGATCNEDSLGG